MFLKRIQAMFYVILLGAVLGVTTQPAMGQDLKGTRIVSRETIVFNVPSGKELTLTGNVIKVEGDTFTISDVRGAASVVVMTPDTRITTRRGVFRGAEAMDRSALMLGIRVQARGRGNDAGQLISEWVSFYDTDCRAVTEVRCPTPCANPCANPMQAELVRQGEQLEETTGIAKTALANAKTAQDAADLALAASGKAQSTADSAQTSATSALTRIGALDDFESIGTLTVHFKVNSFLLSADAKAKLDEFAAKTLASKGYIVELSGYASKEGGRFENHVLSSRRVEMVMDYLIGVGKVPIRRIQPPYSGGISNPVADNNTREGRELNRRVELNLLVSKGLTAGEQVSARSNDK